MPVRLTGCWSGQEPSPVAEVALKKVLSAYPAEGPWRRSVRVNRTGFVILDQTRGVAEEAVFAEPSEGGLRVFGAIRLDRRGTLVDALGGTEAPGGDAGLVLAAYKRWGVAAFARLEGDFAFALLDPSKNSFYLVRDAFGLRRLNFSVCDGCVVFATDIEAILAWPDISRDLDDVVILDTLLGLYLTRVRTFFRAVRRVAPGTFVRFHPSGQEEVRYLRPPEVLPPLKSLAEYSEAFRAELESAVSERIPREGRVVSHVSGGLDAASVACLAARCLSRVGREADLSLANAQFPGLSCDESELAARVAASLRVPLQQWDGRIPDLADLVTPQESWPLGRSSIGGGIQGDLDAAEVVGAEVILSGQGGNEVTQERGYFRDALAQGGPVGFARSVTRLLVRQPWRWGTSHGMRRLSEARSALVPSWLRGRRVREVDPLPTDLQPRWLGARLRRAWPELRYEAGVSLTTTPEVGSFMADAVWKATTRSTRLAWSLEYLDARGSARGVEFRCPFLSRAVIELVMSVPWTVQEPRSYHRVLHREAMRGVLPDEVRNRIAFVFFDEALTMSCQKAQPIIAEKLGATRWKVEDYVDRGALDQVLRDWSPRANDPFTMEAKAAWRVLRDVASFEAWLTAFSG